MIVIPAIDLMKGKVVRLTRGDPSTAKVYDYLGTPAEIAQEWKAQGAKRLHIIDLDAAFGSGDNLEVIEKIFQETCLPIQVGGGIRTVGAIEKLFASGIRYAILGELAFSDPLAITLIQDRFGSESLIIAVDNKNGRVMVAGWKTSTQSTVSEALEKFTRLKVKTYLITSITRDGMLQGPDLESLRKASEFPGVEVIAAGGIGDLEDLIALKKVGVSAVVVGKALYEERFTLREAINAVKGDS